MSQTNSVYGELELKVVLIGDASVGKTSLLNRYITGSHSQNISPTLGAAFTTKLVEANHQTVKLQIWDTSGEERYRSMAPLYYRGAHVVLLVFDVTKEGSFKAIGSWLEQLQGHVNVNQTLLILIGNKVDLGPDERQVTEEQAAAYAKTIKAKYFDASAVSGQNVDEIFKAVSSFTPQVPHNRGKASKDLQPAEEETKKKSCC